MKEIIKYTLDSDKFGASIFFDHVHTRCENQISLHEQDSWELSYVITGKGVRVIGDTMEHFSEGEVVLIPPNIPHCWSFDETVFDKEGKIENISIAFSDKLLEGLGAVFIELSAAVLKIRINKNALSFSGEVLVKLQKMMRLMSSQTKTGRISSLIGILALIDNPDEVNIVGRPVNEDKNV